MKGIWTLVVFMIAIFGFNPGLVQGQSALESPNDRPSLEETLSFIRGTYLGCGYFRGSALPIKVREGDGRLTDGMKQFEIQVIGVSWGASFEVKIEYRKRYTYEDNQHKPYVVWTSDSSYVVESFHLYDLSPDILETNIDGLFHLAIKCHSGSCITQDENKLLGDDYHTQAARETHPGDLVAQSEAISALQATIELQELRIDLKSPKKRTLNQSLYPICSKEVAGSLAKAFSHAITKAGGKKPLF